MFNNVLVVLSWAPQPTRLCSAVLVLQLKLRHREDHAKLPALVQFDITTPKTPVNIREFFKSVTARLPSSVNASKHDELKNKQTKIR